MLNHNYVGLVAATAALVLALPVTAAADHATRPSTKNMHALGHSPHPATFFGEPDGICSVSQSLKLTTNSICYSKRQP